MINKLIMIIVSLFSFLLFFLNCLFLVNEGDSAVILRLGELNHNSCGEVKIYNPGIHFKIPFIDQVNFYDTRLHTLTVDSSRVVTSEQKDVIVDAYLEWKINNIPNFYCSVAGNSVRACVLLKQFLESSLRAEVGKHDIQGLINNERSHLVLSLMKSIIEQSKKIGVSVVDVRIKQIDLPNTVTESIYQRMRSDRHKVASLIRAEGEQISESIRSEADAKVAVSIAKAERDSKRLKAESDAKAAQIYIQFYSKSPKFYNFWRSMQAYQNVFVRKNNIFIMKPDGEFFKYYNNKI